MFRLQAGRTICILIALFFNFTAVVAAQDKVIEPIGDVVQVAIPAIGLASELIRKDGEGVAQFAYSFGTTVLVTAVLKRSIKKKRPEGNGDRAFPSGHTSGAVHGATFIWIRHGWKYGVPASLAAAYVGYSRIEGETNRHDIWDVLGGAAIGSLSALVFTRPIKDKEISLTGNINSNSQSLGFVLTF